MKRLIAVFAVFACFLIPDSAFARDYGYRSMEIEYAVNADSTVDVVERQTFFFEGNYNQAYRSILTDKTSGITDIKVIDGETGKELRRSLWELDKTDPDSWGSYYVESSGNYENVYWYYNLADTEHTWEVKYTMHGAISFMDEFDELYWDAIGNEFEKGVERVKVTVRIPEGASAGDLRFAMYGDHMTNAEVADARTFVFEAENVLPREYFTVAAGWPKGLIDENLS